MKAQSKLKTIPRRKKADGPHPADVYAGRRLREQRLLKGIPQAALAKKLGISFQQLQKYERASNRMSVSAASDLAKILDVHPACFFEDSVQKDNSLPMLDRRLAQCALLFDEIRDKQARAELLAAFEKIARLL